MRICMYAVSSDSQRRTIGRYFRINCCVSSSSRAASRGHGQCRSARCHSAVKAGDNIAALLPRRMCSEPVSQTPLDLLRLFAHPASLFATKPNFCSGFRNPQLLRKFCNFWKWCTTVLDRGPSNHAARLPYIGEGPSIMGWVKITLPFL